MADYNSRMNSNDSDIRFIVSSTSTNNPILQSQSEGICVGCSSNNNDTPPSTRSFEVATEKGGKKIMSEDEVSSLVHDALRRARKATSSFNPRNNPRSNKDLSRPFGSLDDNENIKSNNNSSNIENNKSNTTYSPRSNTSTPKSSRGLISSPSSTSSDSRPFSSARMGSESLSPSKKGRPPIGSSPSASPPSNNSVYPPTYLFPSSSPTKKWISVPNSSSPRGYNNSEQDTPSTMRSTRTIASYHTAKFGSNPTIAGEGENASSFSFDDFHTPTHSGCEEYEEGQEADDDRENMTKPPSQEFKIHGKFSKESTYDGIEIQDDNDDDDDYCNQSSPEEGNSVNSSEDIIRRVEEEIANARKAAQEATRRLAGASANIMATGETTSGAAAGDNDDSNSPVEDLIADLAFNSTSNAVNNNNNNDTYNNKNDNGDNKRNLMVIGEDHEITPHEKSRKSTPQSPYFSELVSVEIGGSTDDEENFDSALDVIGEEFEEILDVIGVEFEEIADGSNSLGDNILSNENHSLSANSAEAVVFTDKEEFQGEGKQNCGEDDAVNVCPPPPTEELDALLKGGYSKRRDRSIVVDEGEMMNGPEIEVNYDLPVDKVNNVAENEEDTTIDKNMKRNINEENKEAVASKMSSKESVIDQIEIASSDYVIKNEEDTAIDEILKANSNEEKKEDAAGKMSTEGSMMDQMEIANNDSVLVKNAANPNDNVPVRSEEPKFEETGNDDDTQVELELCVLSSESEAPKIAVAPSTLHCILDYVPADELKGLLLEELDQTENNEGELSCEVRAVIKIKTSIDDVQAEELEAVLSDDLLEQVEKDDAGLSNNNSQDENVTQNNKSSYDFKSTSDSISTGKESEIGREDPHKSFQNEEAFPISQMSVEDFEEHEDQYPAKFNGASRIESYENDDYQTQKNTRLFSSTKYDNNKQEEQGDPSKTEGRIDQDQVREGKNQKQELIHDNSGYQSIDMLFIGKVDDRTRKEETSSVIDENIEESDDEKKLNDVASNQEKNSSKDNVFIYQVVSATSIEAKPTDQITLSPKGSSFDIDETKDLLKDIRISETIPGCAVDESFEVLAEPIEYTLHNDETNEHVIRMNNSGSNRFQSDAILETERVESNEVVEGFDDALADDQYIANEAQCINEDLPEVIGKGKEDHIAEGPGKQGEYEYSHNDKADTEEKNPQVVTDFQNIEIDEIIQSKGDEGSLASNEAVDAFLEKTRRANAIGPKLDDAQSIDDETDVLEEKEKETTSYDDLYADFCVDNQLKNEENELGVVGKKRQWDDGASDQATEVIDNTRYHNTAKLLRNVLGVGEKNQRLIEITDLDIEEDLTFHSRPVAVTPKSSSIQHAPILLGNPEDSTSTSGSPPPTETPTIVSNPGNSTQEVPGPQKPQHEDSTTVSGKPLLAPIFKERKRSANHYVNDSETRSSKVRFKQRYPVPQQMRKYRHPSEIAFDYQLEKPGEILFYSKPKKDLKELLEAATGTSIPRRSNACGALKVLSTQKKNQMTLIRTQGFMDALVFAIKDNHSSRDSDAGIAARIRAVNVVLNVSVKDNRYHILSHPGLADSFVKCMMDDTGKARELVCATLATLAKTQHCRELMANTPKLVDVLAMILKGDDPSFDKYRPTYIVEEKINYSGDDEMSRGLTESYSSSSSTTNSSFRQDSGESREDQETLRRTRINACAALLHLSKECCISRKLCASNTLLFCLVAVSKEVTNPIHTKCLEIFANLTRFPHNNASLVDYPGLIDSLITNGSHKNDTDRLLAMNIFQNLSSETSGKSTLASSSVLELLIASMMRPQYKEQLAATATIYNISTEPGAVVPLTNTKNVVATLVHVAHSPSSALEVRLIACDALATLGLWLQTLAGAGTVPDGVKASPLPTYITYGWQRWD